jgi:phospholipid/cholesterol/gamma-HCH transport system substrate-binding protein
MRLRPHVLTIALALLVAVAFASTLLLSRGSQPRIGGRSYHVRLLAPDAVSIVPGCKVRIAGLEVGRVTHVDLDGRRAVIDLALDDDEAPVSRDTRFAVRLRTLIGETYIELYPGQGPALADGAVLPMSSQAEEYVDVEQILEVLKGHTRESARDLFRGLGKGLDGRGPELNRFIGRTAGLIDAGAPVVKILDANRTDVAQLVDEFGSVARSLAERGTAIRTLARQSKVALTAVAARDGALRATLDALPSTLSQVRDTSETLRRVTAVSAPVLTSLAGVVNGLRPAVDRLAPASSRGRALIEELGAATPALRSTLAQVRALSGPAVQALPPVRRTFCQLAPMVRYLAPYSREGAAVLQNIASSANYYDAGGHAVRIQLLLGENNFAGYTPQQDEALKLLLNAGVLGRTHVAGYNPFPKPGDVAPPSEGVGRTGPRDVTEPYPRVRAAC